MCAGWPSASATEVALPHWPVKAIREQVQGGQRAGSGVLLRNKQQVLQAPPRAVPGHQCQARPSPLSQRQRSTSALQDVIEAHRVGYGATRSRQPGGKQAAIVSCTAGEGRQLLVAPHPTLTLP